MRKLTLLTLGLVAGAALVCADGPGRAGKEAPKPLFRDPVHDGAADPVLVWNRGERRWFMFYTNRRANVPDTPNVTWVHGTRIGIAESVDGVIWRYRGTASIPYGKEDYTHWAPDVFESDGTYHMFLSIVPGIFPNWDAPREIIHLTSKDLLNWRFDGKVDLESDRVIDATVIRLPGGAWRMWYKNERDKTPLYYADSSDLKTWKVRGPAIRDRSGEGPKVFRWKDRCWMIADVWQGLGVYRSAECETWTRQERNLLVEPGKLPTDRARGAHPDIVVSGDRAYALYFVHQRGADADPQVENYGRRTVIQVVELEYRDGEITCDRDKPTFVHLEPTAAIRQPK